MEHVILQLNKNDNELIDFINQQTELEVLEEKNFVGEILVVNVVLPLTVNLITLVITKMYESKKAKQEKRMIITSDGKYDLSGYTVDEAIDFIMKLKNKEL